MRRQKNGVIIFRDHPEFRPNVTPAEMFRKGSFGGTYWRPIYSGVTRKKYHDQHLEFPKSWWRGLPDTMLTSPVYDPTVNKHGVKCGSSLQDWESKNWIHKQDPYGWVQWYCRFYMGRRTADDARQISRWQKLAGPNGRFRVRASQSPVVRQTLLHWAFTKK